MLCPYAVAITLLDTYTNYDSVINLGILYILRARKKSVVRQIVCVFFDISNSDTIESIRNCSLIVSLLLGFVN